LISPTYIYAAGLVKSIPISSMEANYLKGSIIDVPAGLQQQPDAYKQVELHYKCR
jgi:hypothetical protein